MPLSTRIVAMHSYGDCFSLLLHGLLSTRSPLSLNSLAHLHSCSLAAMSRRAVLSASNNVAVDQPSNPIVYRDTNGTVYLPTHRKHRPPPNNNNQTSPTLSPPPAHAAPSWRGARPSRRPPNYHLPALLTSTPLPTPVVALIFLTFTLQLALFNVFASPASLYKQLPLVYITVAQQLLYFTLVVISRLSPLACLALSPSIFILPRLFPPSYTSFTYISTISALTYWPHLLDLYRYRREFAQWSVWLRTIFLLSYIDLRDGAHITDDSQPPYSPKADSPHPTTNTPEVDGVSTSRSASWATLKPYVMRDVWEAAVKEVQLAACCAALYFLPYATFLPTLQLLLTQPLSSAALLSLANLYARYLSLLLLLTSALSLLDNFYSLIFLGLSLQSFPSQHSPLTCHSLSSFWGQPYSHSHTTHIERI